uniref:Putative leucine-rich repeat domain, L domain-like protein n=1 Tax=Helianthus annuus TaxID=4232 RepID=A0A251SX97_HELAN
MFICLQRLEIIGCWELISLPDNLPKLEDLELYECDKLISLPCNLPRIRELRIEDCNGLLLYRMRFRVSRILTNLR